MFDALIAYSPYLGILAALFMGSLGAPIPEELAIVTAGVLASQDVVEWWLVLPLCFVGVLSGDIILYWVGHHWGDHVLDLRPVRCILDPARRNKLTAAYRKKGLLIVFAARHVMGLRAAAFLTAGIARIPFWKFLVVDALAVAYGVPLGFTLAYLFADRVQELMTNVHRIDLWIVVVVLVGLLVWFGYTTWWRSRKILAPDSEQ
jgi:membrane protein DedA with SNARE-associated domain